MKRFIAEKLLAWKNSERRKPLIIRGARQVGKTWSVLEFGRSQFEGLLHVIDLEQHPDWHWVFDGNLSAKRILSELEILIKLVLSPEETSCFLMKSRAARALSWPCAISTKSVPSFMS